MDLNSKKKDKLEYPICNSRNLWRLLAYLRITTKFVLCRTIQLTIKHQNICFNLYNFIVFSVTHLLPYTQVSLRLQNRLVVALAHTFSLCNHEAEALSGRENGNSGKDVIFARTVSPRLKLVLTTVRFWICSDTSEISLPWKKNGFLSHTDPILSS